MRSLHIRAHVDKQGQVTFRMPSEFADQDVDLVVVFEPLKSAEGACPLLRDGRPAFSRKSARQHSRFDAEIDSEGDFEVRDPLE